MNSWILILTIYSGFSGTAGVTAVYGLADRESCESAGKRYVSTKTFMLKNSYLCVPSKVTK